MTQNQDPNPDQLRTPYAANPTAPASPGRRTAWAPRRRPSGVKPDARLANAFLTQAFLWMFAGLLLTAGVAYVVQSNPKLLEFAAGNFFLLFIAQLAIVMVISRGDQADQRDDRAGALLRLRRHARHHDRPDRRELHGRARSRPRS